MDAYNIICIIFCFGCFFMIQRTIGTIINRLENLEFVMQIINEPGIVTTIQTQTKEKGETQ